MVEKLEKKKEVLRDGKMVEDLDYLTAVLMVSLKEPRKGLLWGNELVENLGISWVNLLEAWWVASMVELLVTNWEFLKV